VSWSYGKRICHAEERRSTAAAIHSIGQPAFGGQGVAHCLVCPLVSTLPNRSSSKCIRADAANLQCNLAVVLGSRDFMNAIAAWTVLISEGKVCAGPAGFFLSLITLKRRSGMNPPAEAPPASVHHSRCRNETYSLIYPSSLGSDFLAVFARSATRSPQC